MNNKKLMISLFSLCLVAIVGLLTTVIVLAATNQNINSSISVTYVATNIKGSVKAQYSVAGGDAVNFTGGSPAGTISFDAEETVSSTLSSGEIILKSDSKYVEFIYTFTNEGTAMDVELNSETISSTANATVEFKVGAEGTYTTLSSTSKPAKQSLSTTTKSVVIYVKVTITSTATDMTIKGGAINWKLSNPNAVK